MQVSELLKIVSEEKPHSFSESKIISWLNEVECEVQQQLGISPFVPVEYDSDNLSAPKPYDRLYVSYVKAKIDMALEDFVCYENDQAQHVVDYRDFVDWVVRTGQSAAKLPELKNVYGRRR